MRKKIYQKPVVIDFGQSNSATGQQVAPTGHCGAGPSPSGFGSECEAGSSNTVVCWVGVGFLGILDDCNNGGSAGSFCRSGGSIG